MMRSKLRCDVQKRKRCENRGKETSKTQSRVFIWRIIKLHISHNMEWWKIFNKSIRYNRVYAKVANQYYLDQLHTSYTTVALSLIK